MRTTVLSLMALAVISACAREAAEQSGADASNTDTGAAMRADTVPAAAAPAAPAVTDPQIAAIVVAANNVDIEASKLARSKATNPKVKEFAERMITDHSGVNKSAVDLVTKLGVKPEENPTSRQLTQGGTQSREELKGKTGVEFDRAYIDNEVAYHHTVLEALDSTLIPSARNAELKALLVSVRPAFVAHIQHAKQVQASLGSR